MKLATVSSKPTTIKVLASAAAVAAFLSAGAAMVFVPQQAEASPADAQKTGQPCAKCHSKPPVLNDYGKSYKQKGGK